MAIFVSQITVLVIGVTVIVLAGWGMFVPEKMRASVTSAMDKYWGIYLAVIVRLVLGSAVIVVAPASRFPIVFHVLGLMTIVAAIVVALMGRERIRRILARLTERFSAPIVRLWLLFGMAFAGFLVYGLQYVALPLAVDRNVSFWPILLKNWLLKEPLLSRFYRRELPDPALPDFLFASGVSVRSFRYFRLSYCHFPTSRRTCP